MASKSPPPHTGRPRCRDVGQSREHQSGSLGDEAGQGQRRNRLGSLSGRRARSDHRDGGGGAASALSVARGLVSRPPAPRGSRSAGSDSQGTAGGRPGRVPAGGRPEARGTVGQAGRDWNEGGLLFTESRCDILRRYLVLIGQCRLIIL